MSDAWLDLLCLCVMGAVGLGAAWLGGQAARRRERWGLGREMYQPILLSLMDLSIHSRYRLRLEEGSDSADPKSQVRLNETIERAAAAMTEYWEMTCVRPLSSRRNGNGNGRHALNFGAVPRSPGCCSSSASSCSSSISPRGEFPEFRKDRRRADLEGGWAPSWGCRFARRPGDPATGKDESHLRSLARFIRVLARLPPLPSGERAGVRPSTRASRTRSRGS